MSNITSNSLSVQNYFICFVDLLGQRNALINQSTMPAPTTKDKIQEFRDSVLQSVGAIAKLHKDAEELLTPTSNNITGERDKLPPEGQTQWDEMAKHCIKRQNWSDGLVLFTNLADASVPCKLNSVSNIFFTAGLLCLLGLAQKRPIRGSIELGWGTELNPSELYGAVIARAYELESQIALYPRIVIGKNAFDFVKKVANSITKSNYEIYDKQLAQLCLNMIHQDSQGVYMIDFLGKDFQKHVTKDAHHELYQFAKTYIASQINTHLTNQDTKLLGRYILLNNYFDQNPAIEFSSQAPHK